MRMMFFALAVLLVCVPAQAQNAFVEGEVDVISVTGCDTLEQANAGVEAWVSGGFMAFSNWMRTIGSERNSRQEPICGNTALPLAAVRTHSEHDVEHKGKMIKVWIVEFISPLGPSLFVFSPKPSRPKGDPA